MQVGNLVVFAKEKVSETPGKRASEVVPLRKSDCYCYVVEKYWTVEEVHEDRTATLVTRRGKRHRISLEDPKLRKATFWERWFLSDRFPVLGRLACGEVAEKIECT